MMNDRALQIRRVSKGIQENRITDADIVAAALDARLAKRKSMNPDTSSQNVMSPAKRHQKSFHFDRDICDPSSKENLENTPSYPASPYRALQGFLEVEHKKKTLQTIRQNQSQTRTLSNSQHLPAYSNAASTTISLPEDHPSDYSLPEPVVDQSEPVSSVVPLTITSVTSTSAATAIPPSAVELRKIMLDFILQTLNSGTYEEITSLKGIGKVRAMKIFTKRNAGYVFDCIDDLEQIGMNSKNIETFVIQNIGFVLGKI